MGHTCVCTCATPPPRESILSQECLSVWAPVSEEKLRRPPVSECVQVAWICPPSALVGPQVMGTSKNRALCERTRTNADCKNVCQCHSGDSHMSHVPPQGVHRNPHSLYHEPVPLSLKPGQWTVEGPPWTPCKPDLGGGCHSLPLATHLSLSNSAP